jgi:PAS domain S-box-containing protein
MINIDIVKSQKVSFLSGTIVACLGGVVLFGWFTHNIALLQVHESFVPMQFNTALGFLFSGIGLVLAINRNVKIAAVALMTVMLIGGLTLIEYIFEIDLSIDQLLMKHYITTETSHPGRMAPNTAFCFLLSGFTLFVVNLNTRYNQFLILGSAVAGLGLIALLGYMTGIETAYGWGHLTRMAFHTSAGFVLIGIGIARWRLANNSTSSKIDRFKNLITTNVTLLVISIALWQALASWEDKRLRHDIEFQADRFRVVMEAALTSQIQAFKRMAQRWEFKGGTPKSEWQAESEAYIRDFEALEMIEWVDPSLNVKWAVPLANHQNDLAFEMFIGDEQRQTLMQAGASKSFNTSEAATLAEGDNELIIYSPLITNQQFDGFLLAIYKINKFVSLISKKIPSFDQNFQLRIFSSGNQIYNFQPTDKEINANYQVFYDVSFKQLKWKIELSPIQQFITESRSSLPSWVLVSGLLMTFLLSITIYLRQKEKDKTLRLKKEIKKRKLIENTLVQSRQALRLILDSAQEGIYGIDLNANTTFVNPKVSELTGYTEDEMQANLHHMLTHESRVDSKVYSKDNYDINTVLSQGEAVSIDNAVFWRKDGTPFFVEYTSSPVHDEVGSIIGVVVTFQDISKRVQHEKELASYTLELERSNQDLDDFAYVASHDLKAPLRGIAQLTSWIEDDVKDALNSETKEYFSLLKSRVSRLEKLLDDLLAYSRIGRKHGDFKLVNLAVLANDIFKLISAPKRFQLVCDINLPELNTLSVPLELVLRNLMSNAVKHHDKDNGIITISAKLSSEGIHCIVADDGPGIPPQQFERVFGMFQTLKPRDEVEGSGMGLAVIKKILNTYHGNIRIESDGIRGTKMHFNWPSEKYLRSLIND